jgi:hypothetical protein
LCLERTKITKEREREREREREKHKEGRREQASRIKVAGSKQCWKGAMLRMKVIVVS